MKYLICVVAILFCASIAQADCPGGQCRPVRSTVKAAGKAVVKVARAPFKCRCRRCK